MSEKEKPGLVQEFLKLHVDVDHVTESANIRLNAYREGIKDYQFIS
jgi:hypothetical protein